MKKHPLVTIVTPSYNQAQYLEETIQSVLGQTYKNIEYILVDGASQDNTMEIIKKYEPWLTYWTSKKDKGQSDALNKGFKRATGEILAWLNSDDYYEPHALARVAPVINASENRYAVMGYIRQVDSNGKEVRIWKTRTPVFFSLLYQLRILHRSFLKTMIDQISLLQPR